MALPPFDDSATPELARRVAALPALDPTPLDLPGDAWERRLLVALADHVERQRWLAGVLERRLGADLERLGSEGGLGHPKAIPQRGPVPGLPGWTYVMEAEAAVLFFLLEPEQGLARLARALHHEVPLVRHEAAALLAIIGTPKAIELLRASGTADGREALAWLSGVEPSPAPEPAGKLIEWRGEPRKAYQFEEIMAAERPGWVRLAIVTLNKRYGALLERWWAS